MAESIKTAVNAFYAEYSVYPLNNGRTDGTFLTNMSTTNTNGGNIRGIAFLEVPPKFTNSSGIVTPRGLYKGGGRSNFFILIDTDGLGYVNPKSVSRTLTSSNVPSSVAVWVVDPTTNTKAVGTFK
jgi:hypothetical protein